MARHRVTDATPADCAGLGDQRCHKAGSGLLWKFHSPTPTVLVFLTPKFHLQGKSSVYRRENLFLKALIVLAIMGAISVEREIRPLFQIRGSLDNTSGLQSAKVLPHSWFCTTRKTDSCWLTSQHKQQHRATTCQT